MWADPNGTTPSIVQIDFGPWGQDMPGDGYAYCGPTSMVMGLYYLYANGFTQLAPGWNGLVFETTQSNVGSGGELPPQCS
jgi:hypothetical protein